MAHRLLIIALAVLALLAAGCGDSGSRSSAPTAPPAGSGGVKSDGEAVFADAGCAACHKLAAAGAEGASGPNLDVRRPNVDEVKSKVKGGGGGMPSYSGRLTDAQIQAVADYVAQNAGR